MNWFQTLKEKVKALKKNIVPVYYALFDKRTPIIAKIFAGITVAYLLSPIDLIPDFIPVLGLLDDLILIPILIKITLSLIPSYIIEELKLKMIAHEKLDKNWLFAVPIVLIYIFLLYFLYRYFDFHWADFSKFFGFNNH